MPTNLLEQAGEFINQPLERFADALPITDAFPYRRVPSLTYLIEYLEAKKEKAKGPTKLVQEAIIADMKEVQKSLQNGEMQTVKEGLASLLEVLYPEFLEGNAMGFASIPFAREFIYETPGMRSFQQDERYKIQLQKTPVARWASSAIVQAGGIILSHFYGQQFDFSLSDIFAIQDVETSLVQYKRLQPSTDYFRAKAIKPLPPIDQSIIQRLLENFEDTELWLKYLPPTHFQFEGIVFGRLSDVTVSEVNSRLKERLLNTNLSGESPRALLKFIENELRNYLRMPALRFGVYQLPGSFADAIQLRGSLLGNEKDVSNAVAFSEIYQKVIKTHHPFIIEDVVQRYEQGKIEQKLADRGIRSLIIAPLLDERNRILGVIELASPIANQLNAFALLRMKGLFPLFNSGFSRFRRQWEEQINFLIQDKYTSIHHSVRWKFEAKAAEYLQSNGMKALKPILFRNLIPLYGQADVVGSTTTRNRATQEDLQATFAALIETLRTCCEKLDLHLIDNYRAQTEELMEHLQEGFSAADESSMVLFLTEEVYPFLEEIAQQYTGEVGKDIQAYFSILDADYRMVYDQRKKYDLSLQQINLELGKYMEREEKAMQKVLPHYFSVFKTDGVEYNIYMGQSILRKGTFSDYHRKNFELWQLQCMIGITRMVAQMQTRLPMPLKTAQLIFAYGSAINIQFRMDEKQFDVEGAYNVGYEILKKRIDKAIIQGTGERLTQPGYIAIVYLQARDRQKYQNFMDYLSRKGYLEPDIEHHVLAPLQGVEGLRALRAKVTLQDDA